jgi:arylsulfatase A-like enzyme
MNNLGYGEIGVYGGDILRGAPTPRIALASEGMHLLNFNVEAQCTPSRAALMTGRMRCAPVSFTLKPGASPGLRGVVSSQESIPLCGYGEFERWI